MTVKSARDLAISRELETKIANMKADTYIEIITDLTAHYNTVDLEDSIVLAYIKMNSI